MANRRRQKGSQAIDVLGSLGQHDGRSALAHRFYHVLEDQLIAAFVRNQFIMDFAKLETGIGPGLPRRTERGRTNNHPVLESTRCRLPDRVDMMAHRAALHENDRVMTILAGHGRR